MRKGIGRRERVPPPMVFRRPLVLFVLRDGRAAATEPSFEVGAKPGKSAVGAVEKETFATHPRYSVESIRDDLLPTPLLVLKSGAALE